MVNRILVALDGKPASEQALKQAITLAKLFNAALIGISVIEKLPAYAASVGEVEETKNDFENFFINIQNQAIQAAEANGVAMKTIIKAGNTAQILMHYAEENSVDLIVLGAESRRGLGSTADKVTEAAPCSVLVARVNLPSVRVRDAMTRQVTSVSPSTPLNAVVELLVEKGLKATPVVENGKVIGIITGGDLLSRAGMAMRITLQRNLPSEVFSEQVQQLAEVGKTARDIMTSPAITINENERIIKATAIMAEKNIKRLPVVDKDGKLVGIISRLDILALAVSSSSSPELFPAISGITAKTAGDIMFRDVPTVDPDTSLNEVINKILSTPLRRVVVVDENRHVQGIIVDTDLVKEASSKKSSGLFNILSRFSHAAPELVNFTEKARDVMSRDVFSVHSDTPLVEVIRLMIDKQIKRLVVTDAYNRLVGMVSRESILRVLTSK